MSALSSAFPSGVDSCTSSTYAASIAQSTVSVCTWVTISTPFFVSIERKTSMPQAMMDPEQVRRFADELQRFNRDLQNRMGSLHARFAALGDTWQDQEHTKFSDEFKQTVKALKKFVEMSDQHVPYLLRKAQ